MDIIQRVMTTPIIIDIIEQKRNIFQSMYRKRHYLKNISNKRKNQPYN